MDREPAGRGAVIDPATLKRDRPFNRAAIIGYVLAIALTVAIGAAVLPQTGWIERRGTAAYWIVMLPAAAWVIALASFSRWAIALLPVVLGGTPLVLAALAATRSPGGGGEALTYWIAAAATAVLGGLGLRWLARSSLRQPSRRQSDKGRG